MKMDLFNNLEQFLRPDSEAELAFKNLTKQLFDNIKQLEHENDNKSSLSNLVVDCMDDEGIWTQLDIENQEFLKNYLKEFCQNEKPDEEDNFANNNLQFDTDDEEDLDDENLDNEEGLDDEDLDDEEGLDDEDLDDEEGLDDEDLDDEENLNDEDLDEEEDFEDEELENKNFWKGKVDDTLFNPSSKQINYDKELAELDDEESEEEGDEMMSEFQKHDAETQKKVKALEDELLKEKPWQLKGEVSATDRPQDSLLEEYVDFESGTRPMPIYTEEFTKKLEEIILQRIKTNKFDDVVKKERKVEQPFDFKRRIMLETEKSKVGLAKVYENEFLKQKGASQQDENPLHKEIKEKMRRLFVQLDSLCNFNYVPRASNSEIKVINNLPAINLEEAIPDTVSDAKLIAPQEIIPVHKKDLKADEEKTKTDKLRERRLKKKLIREKIRFKEQNGLATNFKKFKSDKASSVSDKKNEKIAPNKESEAVKNVFMKSRKNR